MAAGTEFMFDRRAETLSRDALAALQLERLRATVERESVARRTLKNLVANLFGGCPRQAIAYLLKDEKLDDADLEEIRRLIDSQRKRSDS